MTPKCQPILISHNNEQWSYKRLMSMKVLEL